MSENKVNVVLEQTTTRSMILPDYFTVGELKQRFINLGYNISPDKLLIGIMHKGTSFYIPASDNTYITDGDKVYIGSQDNFDAVAELEKEEQEKEEEDLFDENSEVSISVRLFI